MTTEELIVELRATIGNYAYRRDNPEFQSEPLSEEKAMKLLALSLATIQPVYTSAFCSSCSKKVLTEAVNGVKTCRRCMRIIKPKARHWTGT